MPTIVRASLIMMVALLFASRPAFAQLENLQQPPAPQQPQPAAPEEPGIWTGSASAGLSLTSGNTDTLSFNLGFDLTRDPKTRNIMKARGLYLRGDDNNTVTANRATASLRDEYSLTPRVFIFGKIEYLQDEFKLIDYLVAPTGGVGFKIIDTDPTKFSVTAGGGAVVEKNPGQDAKTDGALTAGEEFSHQLTDSASFREVVNALWKTGDFADSLYAFGIGIAARISAHSQLTFDVIDTFKNRPATAATKKNDVAVVTAIAAKF